MVLFLFVALAAAGCGCVGGYSAAAGCPFSVTPGEPKGGWGPAGVAGVAAAALRPPYTPVTASRVMAGEETVCTVRRTCRPVCLIGGRYQWVARRAPGGPQPRLSPALTPGQRRRRRRS